MLARQIPPLRLTLGCPAAAGTSHTWNEELYRTQGRDSSRLARSARLGVRTGKANVSAGSGALRREGAGGGGSCCLRHAGRPPVPCGAIRNRASAQGPQISPHPGSSPRAAAAREHDDQARGRGPRPPPASPRPAQSQGRMQTAIACSARLAPTAARVQQRKSLNGARLLQQQSVRGRSSARGGRQRRPNVGTRCWCKRAGPFDRLKRAARPPAGHPRPAAVRGEGGEHQHRGLPGRCGGAGEGLAGEGRWRAVARLCARSGRHSWRCAAAVMPEHSRGWTAMQQPHAAAQRRVRRPAAGVALSLAAARIQIAPRTGKISSAQSRSCAAVATPAAVGQGGEQDQRDCVRRWRHCGAVAGGHHCGRPEQHPPGARLGFCATVFVLPSAHVTCTAAVVCVRTMVHWPSADWLQHAQRHLRHGTPCTLAGKLQLACSALGSL